MNKFGKATLLAGASAFALGMAASQASAFDDVDWEWDANINEKIKLYINPDFWQLDPRGLVQAEVLQISIGDIKATSEVKHIYNKTATTYGDPEYVPVSVTGDATGHLGVYGKTYGHLKVDGTASGPIAVSGSTTGNLDVYGKTKGSLHVYGKAKDDCWWGGCDYDPVKGATYGKLDIKGTTDGSLGVNATGSANLDVYGKTKGHLGVHGGTYGKLHVTASGYAKLPVIVPNTLKDLAEVNSSAVAVANISTVQGNSAVFVHDGQFSIGGFKNDYILEVPTNEVASVVDDGPEKPKGDYGHYDPVDNTNHDLAAIALIAAGLGLIEPADVSADSTVYDILNANVNSSATAVANMHQIDVEAELPTDVMVIADVTQFSYGDVSANSHVSGVKAYHFEGLGGLANGLVNSSATAVGNMSNINVNVTGPAEAPAEAQ